MVVILDPEDYDAWLTSSPDEAKDFFKQWSGALKDYPKPLAPRKRKSTPAAGTKSNLDAGDELFPPVVV